MFFVIIGRIVACITVLLGVLVVLVVLAVLVVLVVLARSRNPLGSLVRQIVIRVVLPRRFGGVSGGMLVIMCMIERTVLPRATAREMPVRCDTYAVPASFPRSVIVHSAGTSPCQLLQVRANDIDQLVGSISASSPRREGMRADVIFKHFCHQAVHRTTRGRDESQDLAALAVVLQGTIHGFHLSPNPTDTCLELLPVPDRVTHAIALSCRLRDSIIWFSRMTASTNTRGPHLDTTASIRAATLSNGASHEQHP